MEDVVDPGVVGVGAAAPAGTLKEEALSSRENGENGSSVVAPVDAPMRKYYVAALAVALASLLWQAVLAPMRRDWQAACGRHRVRVGDGYCDCVDGRDERPFLSNAGCGGFFECERALVEPYWIRRSRARDGVADCCDASDEGRSFQSDGTTCVERARAELGRLEEQEAVNKRADALRKEYAAEVEAAVEAAAKEIERLRPWLHRLFTETQHPDPMRAGYARQQYQQATRRVQPRKDAAEANSAVYGHDGAWLALYGRCFESAPLSDKVVLGGTANVDPQKYTFRYCPFANVTQRPLEAEKKRRRVSPFEAKRKTEDPSVVLGTYLAWAGRGNASSSSAAAATKKLSHFAFSDPFFAASPNRGTFQRGDARLPGHLQFYDEGAPCVGGRARHVFVDLTCGLDNEVRHVHEDGLCSYVLVFQTPLACQADPVTRHLLRRKISKLTSVLNLPTAATFLRLLRIYSSRLSRYILALVAADPSTFFE